MRLSRVILTFLSIALSSILSSCSSGLPISSTYSSKAFASRVEYIILHFTVGNFEESLHTLTQGEVSSHYLVSADPPKIYRLVHDNMRAFHAGESFWNGDRGLNNRSIGIEIVNAGCKGEPSPTTCASYSKEQIDLVIQLVKQVSAEHRVAPQRVLGHSDIAPHRKLDPGPNFPWWRLAQEGLVIWPHETIVKQKKDIYEANPPDPSWYQSKLSQIGYRMPNSADFTDSMMKDTIRAVQMKYRPHNCDGNPDAETAAIIDTLTTF